MTVSPPPANSDPEPEGSCLGAPTTRSAPVGDALDAAVEAVVRCAHRIWDDKAIGLIYAHYDRNVRVHQTGAEQCGRGEVVEATVQRLAAFPDLRLYGDEVIWNRELDGVLLSHRVTSSAHHHGHGTYGPPTGHRVHRREITQYTVRAGRVHEVWSVQDELALVRQLGLDEWALARAMVQAEADRSGQPAPTYFGEGPSRATWDHALPEPDGGPQNPAELPELIYGLIWNARMLNVVHRVYAPTAVIWVPGHRRLDGPQALTAYVLQWLAAFPDGAVQVEHVAWTEQGAQGFKVAVRWTFRGTHTGAGVYGSPTQRRVHVLGISHFDIQGGQVVREDMVWNEFALLKQLCRPDTP
ncbi:ester cyclase [Deinococcus hopiensis]|uniref:ester cyclase n=1 Tax=Deinococcus hopiensis TaxID=309885 RepID=UPI001FE728CF|nr:ester cyclase [Deinococcus hopiensis]